jgi:MFS family permease
VNFPGTIEILKTTHRVRRLSRPAGFVRFLFGDGLGVIGSIFYQVALPALIIGVTGSAAQVGGAILLTGAARIALVLAGGALCDRVSPLRLASIAAFVRAGLVTFLAWTAAIGRAGPIEIAAICLALGACDAVQIPARGALVPSLVAADGLLKANGLLAAQEKALGLAAPAVAGMVVSWFGNRSGFAIDAALLAASGWLLAGIRLRDRDTGAVRDLQSRQPEPDGSLLDLLRLIWRERPLLGAVGMVLGVNLLSVGPLCVGLPVLAYSRFADGAQALGLWMSAAGCGALAGTLLAGVLPPPDPYKMGRLAVLAVGLAAAGVLGLWLANGIWMSAAAVFWLACVGSCANVIGLAQVQALTPRGKIGRMMGILSLK